MDQRDIVYEIVSYLKIEEKKKLRNVNKLWDQVIRDQFRTQKKLIFGEGSNCIPNGITDDDKSLFVYNRRLNSPMVF